MLLTLAYQQTQKKIKYLSIARIRKLKSYNRLLVAACEGARAACLTARVRLDESAELL